MRSTEVPDWVTFPDGDWEAITPEDAGLDRENFQRFLADLDARGASVGGEVHEDNNWGTVVTRGGYLLHVWGNKDYKFQTASLGKTFIRALFGLAVEEGMVEPDDLISDTWTGEGQLSHPHKYLDQGHHKTLIWRHLLGDKYGSKQYGGFPLEIGYFWKMGPSDESKTGYVNLYGEEGFSRNWMVPEWAKWSGDPFYDNYAHIEPGTIAHYSSGGFWRLGQALTVLWNRDLKEVLDEKLLSKIGIPADQWEWLPGQVVQKDKNFYPLWPSAWDYLDPPYEVNECVVRSGPGWVVMSGSDLARFGHLVATRGNWKGDQLLDPQWLRGHGGGNGSGVCGESTHYTAMGMVTTRGIDPIPRLFGVMRESVLPADCFVGPVKVS